MAKNTLIGVSSAAKKINKIYVGVSNVAHKVKKGYIGIDGVARLFYTGDPVLIYESSTAGSKSLSLSAGTYEITLIGGGGGGVGRRSTVTGTKHYAQGGVGGTLQIIAVLAAAATVSITVGTYGTSSSDTFSSASGGTTTAASGTASTITGFTNLTASAGGGTGASIRATSTSAANRTVGTIGTCSVSGSALQETLINNPNTCTPGQGSSTATTRAVNGRVNDNWPEDTTRGKGGDVGWNGTSFLKGTGVTGFVRIRQL